MSLPLHKKNVVLIGGDRREVELYLRWREQGIKVKMAGFDHCPEVSKTDLFKENDLQHTAVLIAPLSGIKENGTVVASFTNKALPVIPLIQQSPPQSAILAGSVAPAARVQLQGRELIITGDDAELAVLNAVPTAEGAIQKAMELSDLTLHGSSCIVIGLGRCGSVLAGRLQGLGARVTAVVRRPETAALAETMGMDAIFPEQLGDSVRRAEFIFNTVPAPLLHAAVLRNMLPDAVLLDLASSPGGTDFQAAERLGLKAVLLPGLPGKRAPRSAARILERVYARIIRENKVGEQGSDLLPRVEEGLV